MMTQLNPLEASKTINVESHCQNVFQEIKLKIILEVFQIRIFICLMTSGGHLKAKLTTSTLMTS